MNVSIIGAKVYLKVSEIKDNKLQIVIIHSNIFRLPLLHQGLQNKKTFKKSNKPNSISYQEFKLNKKLETRKKSRHLKYRISCSQFNR